MRRWSLHGAECVHVYLLIGMANIPLHGAECVHVYLLIGMANIPIGDYFPNYAGYSARYFVFPEQITSGWRHGDQSA